MIIDSNVNTICLFCFFEGMAQFVGKFAEPGDAEYSPPIPVAETPVMFSSFVTNFMGIIIVIMIMTLLCICS